MEHHRGAPLTPSRAGTHAILVAAQLCFAALPVVGRLALAGIPPNAVVYTRLVGGAAIFWVIARARGSVRVARADLPLVALCALMGVGLNQLLFVNGLARSTATNASLLGATSPVFAAVIAVVTGRERFLPRRMLGIAIALAGVLVLVGVEGLSLDATHAIGNLMLVANSLCYALFLLLGRRLSLRYAPMTLVALLFACGTVLLAPLGAPALAAFAPIATARDVAFLAVLVAVPTVGAYSLTQIALRRADASLVASYIYLQPLLATTAAVWLLGERPGPRTAMAAALILAGVAVSARAAVSGAPTRAGA